MQNVHFFPIPAVFQGHWRGLYMAYAQFLVNQASQPPEANRDAPGPQLTPFQTSGE